MTEQRERIFFHPDGTGKPTDAERLELVSRDSPLSPFSRFIGNDNAIKKLQTGAYSALGQYNHMMRELSYSIFGPSSSGKTMIARLYAECVGLPFVELSPKSVKTVEDLFKEISRILLSEGLPLVEYQPGNYMLPPIVIFFDEVHALTDSVVQGLLKATEYNDAMMVTESGKKVSTFNATWMIATTDEGKLFDAFRTRFSPVVLKYLTKADIAVVVSNANPDLPFEVCELVAHYNSRIPRKALEFARYMRLFRDMHPGSWESVALSVAKDEGIDSFGMHEVHLKILTALGQGPIAKSRIALIAGRKDEETDRYILPWLLTETDDQESFVSVSRRGYTITEAGICELDKRNICHKFKKEVVS